MGLMLLFYILGRAPPPTGAQTDAPLNSTNEMPMLLASEAGGGSGHPLQVLAAQLLWLVYVCCVDMK